MNVGGARCQVMDGQNRGSSLYHDGSGFFYHLREIRGERVRLRCRQRKRGCRGSAVVDLDSMELVHRTIHNHSPDPLFVQDRNFRSNLIQYAVRSTYGRTPTQILIEAKSNCPDIELSSRFTTARMRSALYTARMGTYPPIPRTLLHLGILVGLPNMRAVCSTVDGSDTIFRGVAGYARNRSVSLVFVSGRMLHFLQERSSLHADGTFRKRPRKPVCTQIFNIVTRYGHTVIGILRALMMSRSEVAYFELLRYIKQLAPSLQPSRIHCDFEKAQVNAWRRIFPPPCEIVGCLWHYAVACSSYGRNLGLTRIASSNDLVMSFIRCLCAAPLLPKHKMYEGVMEIRRELDASAWPQELGPLFDYWEMEWLPKLEILSVFGQPERTNNCSESDNRMLANVFPANRPNVWRLIGGIARLEHLSWSDKMAVDRGQSVNGPRRWSTIATDQLVARNLEMLLNGDISPGQFLHRISWRIMPAVMHGLRIERNEHTSTSSSDSE